MTAFEEAKDEVFKGLVDLKNIFEAAKVPYYLEGGNLLCLYRDGDLQSHDLSDQGYRTGNPIIESDLLIPAKAFYMLGDQVHRFEQAGFRLITRGQTIVIKGKPCYLKLWLVRGRYYEVDIGPLFPTKDGRICFTPNIGLTYIFPMELFGEPSQIEWRGETFAAPTDIKEYLVRRFRNWKEVEYKPEYNSEGTYNYTDPECIPCLDLNFDYQQIKGEEEWER